MKLDHFLLIALLLGICGAQTRAESPAPRLERSFWVHASLGLFTQRNYFGPDYPATPMPTRAAVENAVRLLTRDAGANRLYLIYHRELPLADAEQLFAWWQQSAGPAVETVPALVLSMYDQRQTPVFSEQELKQLARFFRQTQKLSRLAIYDIAAGRTLPPGAGALAGQFPDGLIRLGLQPGEAVAPPSTSAVQDTWSAFCHGRRNVEDWRQPGFGAETLRKWVQARNGGTARIAWDLVAVAWDYTATERGGYPGYDDATKNMPLPAERNRLAAELIQQTASTVTFGGFSSDLYILHENSRTAAHDGRDGSFYECLKRGEAYAGYYREPWEEIVAIYRNLRESEQR